MAYFTLYTKEHGAKKVNLSDFEVKSVLDMNEEILMKKIRQNKPNHYENISFNEYLYLCSTYKFKIHEYNDRYKEKQQFIKEKLKFIGIISTILENNAKLFNKLFSMPKSMRNYRSSFELSSDIIDEMNNNMDCNYDEDERMIYYYFKMLFMFESDSILNFVRMIDFSVSPKYKKSFNNLYYISLDNNEVACFEFVEILKYFAKREGFIVSNYNIDNYGTMEHVTLDVVTNKTYFNFDSLSSNKPYDMISVKLKKGYNGIKYMSKDPNIKNKINKVYKDVLKEYSKPSKKKYKNEIIDNIVNNINDFNISEEDKKRLKSFIDSINNIPLKGIEYYSEVLSNIKTFLDGSSNKNILPIVVCAKVVKYGFNLLIMVQEQDKNVFYLRFTDTNVEIITKEKIEEYIRSNKIITCIYRKIENNKMNVSYSFIPGIDENIQKEYNKVAKNNIVPRILNKISKNRAPKPNKKLVKN